MAYVRSGQVVQPGVLDKVVSLFWSLVNGIAYFFQTLVDPTAAAKYKDYGRRKKWEGGGGARGGPGGGGGPPGGGGGGGGGPRGPRITGLSDYKGGPTSAGACGSCCGG